MKAIIEFDLDDPSDQEKYNCYNQSVDLTLAIWTFVNYDLRDVIKYGEDMEKVNLYDEVRDLLLERLEEYNINLDILS